MNRFENLDYRYFMFLGVLIFLPGVEALKNIFAFLFVLSWILTASKENYWGGKWQTIDTIFLLWILADIIVSINAVISHQLPGSNFTDVIRFILLGWILSRTDFTNEKNSNLAFVSLIATIVTLAFSYYSTGGILKELHSVGHINHTAIFLLIAYSISSSLLTVNFDKLNKYQKIILLLVTLILFFSTIDTGSRAAFGLLVVITLLDFIYIIIRKRKFLLFFILASISFFIAIIFINDPPNALQRILDSEHILQDDTREKINNLSYYAFKENPLLGIGFGNYGHLEIEDIIDEVLNKKGVFDISQFQVSSHPHNVYYNYLVSGGILIFSVFAWFWIYVIWLIFKIRLTIENEWIVLSSIGVLIINLGIGWVNTTLHHEHAILSMFILGLLISNYRQSKLKYNLNILK